MARMVRLLCAALAVAAVSCAMAQDAGKTVRFVTDREKEGGFLIEVTREAFRKVGYTVQVEFMPWSRALATVTGGGADALLGAYYSPEREKHMLYSDSIGESDIVFFKLAESPITYASLRDLAPYTVGTIRGAAYTPEFDQAAYIRKEAVADFDTNIRKLLLKRIPLIVEKRAVVMKALAEKYPAERSRIVALEIPLKAVKFYNAFSRAVPGYEQKVGDFNEGLKMIARDGDLARIMARDLHE
jgi:polar amino acid transport system substrate-binding protein